jgi:hypothetical protein
LFADRIAAQTTIKLPKNKLQQDVKSGLKPPLKSKEYPVIDNAAINRYSRRSAIASWTLRRGSCRARLSSFTR